MSSKSELSKNSAKERSPGTNFGRIPLKSEDEEVLAVASHVNDGETGSGGSAVKTGNGISDILV